MQEGKYMAKVVQYGFLTGAIDPATKQAKPPQFFAKMGFVDENNVNQTQTFFGGFKELQPGKKTSQREFTFNVIKAMGYSGTQIAQLAAGTQSNLLNLEKELEIELEYQKDAMGTVKVDDKGNPYFSIKYINDPENTGFKNQMNPQDAAVIIGGLNLDAEMANLNGSGQNAAPNNGGYDLNQNANNNVQQNVNQNAQNNNGQNNNQNNSQQNNFNQNNNGQQNTSTGAPDFNQQQNNQMTNQQMGFNQNGMPPF